MGVAPIAGLGAAVTVGTEDIGATVDGPTVAAIEAEGGLAAERGPRGTRLGTGLGGAEIVVAGTAGATVVEVDTETVGAGAGAWLFVGSAV